MGHNNVSTGTILFIGLLGNGIVVAVISNLRRRGQKTSVQLFLLNLAVSDLMVCLLCIPLTIFTNFYYPKNMARRDDGFCKLARFMQVKDLFPVKLRTNGRNNSQHCWPYSLTGLKLCKGTPNNTKQHATKCGNGIS